MPRPTDTNDIRRGPYTTEQVLRELEEEDRRERAAGHSMDDKALNWRGCMLGFEYWGSFVRLASGWYLAVEDVCPYCLYHVVRDHGSREERQKWREQNLAARSDKDCFDAIDPDLYPMPVTNREAAEHRAAMRRKRKAWRRERLKARYATWTFEEFVE